MSMYEFFTSTGFQKENRDDEVLILYSQSFAEIVMHVAKEIDESVLRHVCISVL